MSLNRSINENLRQAAETLSEAFGHDHEVSQRIWRHLGLIGCSHDVPDTAISTGVENAAMQDDRETLIGEADWNGQSLYYGTSSKMSRLKVALNENPPHWAKSVHMTEAF